MTDPGNSASSDQQHLWHPFTQQRDWHGGDVLTIERGEGVYLFDDCGARYIDGVSSLWCNVHGHRHPTIDAAVRAQLDRVAHTTMLGLTHAPGAELARRLIELAPAGLQRVFYSDNGSTAAEVALKMAFQYWQQVEDDSKRTGFIALKDAYHGDTIGSVSAGGIDLFHSLYRPLLFDTWKAEPGDLADMERLLAAHGDQVAAVIVEPLVQGAAGMITHPDGYLRGVRELCDRYGVFLICDEVAVGFGRTGKMFACEHEGVSPDFMCLAKGLTGGYLPLAATLTTQRVYEAFLGSAGEFKTFFHGHTFTGNPLACAAALATLDVFEHENTLDHVAELDHQLGELLQPVAELEYVIEIRRRGLMCGIELAQTDPDDRVAHQVVREARSRGAIIRPLGNVIVLMPPLSITADQLSELVAITIDSIEVVAARAGLSAIAAASR